ncbi:hypothetical protein [uncultured Comamonas sp.]|uniref:hypothetical protein n=1 Tax=uncultured Comamonas sp. TaxID=114710 RepID=UPI0037499ED0
MVLSTRTRVSVFGVADTVTGPEVADEPPEAAVIVTAAPLPTAPTQLSTWNDSTPALPGARSQVSTVRAAFSEPPLVPLHTVAAVAVGSQRMPAGKVAVIVLLSVFDAL